MILIVPAEQKWLTAIFLETVLCLIMNKNEPLENYCKLSMKKSMLIITVSVIFILGFVSPAVSAADAVNGKDVPNNGFVLIGETGLNFTNFSNSGTYDVMVYLNNGETPNWGSVIDITNPTNVYINPTVMLEKGWYFPGNLASGTYNRSLKCYVTTKDTFPIHYEDDMGKTVTSLDAEVNENIVFTLKGRPGATYLIYQDGVPFNPNTVTLDRSSSPGVTLNITPTYTEKITILAVNSADNNDKSELIIHVGVKNDFREFYLT